jgi:hypothetical protein
MLDANSPTFREQYPNGATVYDRTGCRISGVVAFDPETGEVIRHGKSSIVGAILRMARGRQQRWDLPAEFCRHGFWPAPLTIRANTPPSPNHPMCRCIPIPLKLATEADLAYVNDEPLPEVAWRSLATGEAVTIEGFPAPHDSFNGSYKVSSVSHTTIPAID